MKRAFWVIGISVALVMTTTIAILCASGLIFRNHWSLKAWTLLMLNGYAAQFLFTCLRSAIRFGDPTAHLVSEHPQNPFLEKED